MPICILSCLSKAAAFSGSVFVFDMEVSLSILCVKVQTCKQCLTMISVFNIEVSNSILCVEVQTCKQCLISVCI